MIAATVLSEPQNQGQSTYPPLANATQPKVNRMDKADWTIELRQ